MTFLQHEVFRETSYQRNIISKTLEAGRELSRTGSKHDGIEARWENPKLDKNPNFAHQNGSIKIFGIDHGTKIHQKGQNRANRSRSSRWLELRDQNVVSTVQQSECLQKLKSCSLTSERSGGVLHVSWTCSQPCGARGAAVHASGAMRSDTPGGHQPESDWLLSSINSPRPLPISSHPDLSKAISRVLESFRDQFSIDFESAPREGSVQLKSILTEKASSVQSAILYDCDAEPLSKSFRPGQSVPLMIKWRYCPELFQFHGFRSVKVLLDTPPGSPKNCSGAKGGSVQISLSRPVSFFMVKPRFCPSRDQFPLSLKIVSQQEAGLSGVECLVRIWNFSLSGFKETPYSLDREDSDERGHVLWLSITRRCNVAMTRRTVGCRAVTRRTVGRGRLKVPSSGLCGREIGYCR
ncbi:hypothetical protein F2Q69_00049994 [Brassica cretica]|uniref:Uncharacterized protein n=1 Tax=Brassica cretica TaxID=69181 RepID=A0A8S9PYN7_BRACR|nr:hypothetical protein F2Q69_00049994 [Brassica cretica]